jgi:hypothetical protein
MIGRASVFPLILSVGKLPMEPFTAILLNYGKKPEKKQAVRVAVDVI